MDPVYAPASRTTCDQCRNSFPSGFYLEKSRDGRFLCEKCRVAQLSQVSTEKLPFSIGAAGITILWLFFHGRPGTAVALIGLNLLLRALVLIPGLGFILALIVVVGVIVHFGSEGSKIAME